MADTDFVDVLIVGAGLSGIGSARHLQRLCPDRSFALLESRESLGGTWDLFRYPGIRSDSDMYTLGYSFKPWLDRKSLADGPSILRRLEETAAEAGVGNHIRYNHKVLSAAWSSKSATWIVSVKRGGEGSGADEVHEYTCRFLLMCAGYYDYEEGYTPEFEGRNDFQDPVIHAQHWSEDLDYSDKIAGSRSLSQTG